MNREEFKELEELLIKQLEITNRAADEVFYRRDIHGETDSPRHLLSELAVVRDSLEKPEPPELQMARSGYVFVKVRLFELQMEQQKARAKQSQDLTDEERETLLTEDEIADITEAIRLKREIEKRAKEIRKKDRGGR